MTRLDELYDEVVDQLDNYVRPTSLARTTFINSLDAEVLFRLAQANKVTADDFAEWGLHQWSLGQQSVDLY